MKVWILALALVAGCASSSSYPAILSLYQGGKARDAVSQALPLAQDGDVDCQYLLGDAYFHGVLGEPDYEQAYRWFSAAAEQGHPEAQHFVGILYSRGAYVEANQETAVSWYRRAAEAGSPSAQFDLAWRYESGRGIERDFSLAEYWYRAAAAQGDEAAARNLRILKMRLPDEGMASSEEFARLQDRAAAGDRDAQWKLANIFASGDGLRRDTEKAFYWLRQAARNGHPEAQQHLERIEGK